MLLLHYLEIGARVVLDAVELRLAPCAPETPHPILPSDHSSALTTVVKLA